MALEFYGQKAEKIHLVLLDLIMPGMEDARCLQESLQIGLAIIISNSNPISNFRKVNSRCYR
jgi:hypothetical protein